MRKIGTIEDEVGARLFVDYLAVQGVAAQLRAGPEGSAVWIVAEQDVERARAEFDQYRSDPLADRYLGAGAGAQRQLAVDRAAKREERRRERAASRRWTARGENYLTFAIMATAAVVTVAVDFGSPAFEDPPDYNHVTWWLLATDAPAIAQDSLDATGAHRALSPFPDRVLSGQVWRLLTPVFVHFSHWHLIFNLLGLLHLGSMIEMRRGWRYFGIVALALALISNTVQALFQAYFGGLSGVVYGLFGFVWMRMRYQGNEGYYLDRTYIAIMIGWFFVCFVGLLPIANAAHASGLITGLCLGAGPFWWGKLRRWWSERVRQ